MSKQVGTIIMLLGIVAVFVLGYRCVSKGTKARIEARQKKAFEQALAGQEVQCDECGEISSMNVPFIDRRKFQVCPKCGAKKARPIVYYVCSNPECNRQLVKVRNIVWEEGVISYGDPIVCPNCGRPNLIEPSELHIVKAKKIAEETDQPFP